MPELGEKAESRFKRLIEQSGFTAKHANRYQDSRCHVDFTIWRGKWVATVDVKALKKINRRDKTYDTSTVWVEWKNVCGYNGWLYGDADYIAFERPKAFWMVKRQMLFDLAMQTVDFSFRVTKPSDAINALYSRKGRKDELSRIKTRDLYSSIAWIIQDE